ncbi:hypothetical protein E2C01_055216 [Portunus trituberculatus]|uniref:Uncharacterized protein n=1 Tax=Portunus trituberculatus TaxID=210409 RepID=A0A5B7GQL3_PORTR|nr:hypothetical protein [Portunus trituberculatus]
MRCCKELQDHMFSTWQQSAEGGWRRFRKICSSSRARWEHRQLSLRTRRAQLSHGSGAAVAVETCGAATSLVLL